MGSQIKYSNILVSTLCLGIAFAVVQMATISELGAHPDERDHINAAEYYAEHWLPPVIGSEESSFTRSNYGYSYLDELDVVYIFAGKVGSVVTSINFFRYFQIFLFVILLGFLITAEKKLPLLIFLISSQVWYVFSYSNSDAFPFLVSFLIVLISLPVFYVEEVKDQLTIKRCVYIGVLLGLLLISKVNYYTFIIYFGLIGLWVICYRTKFRETVFKRGALIVFCACMILISRLGFELSTNSLLDRSERIAEAQERYADYQYKMSTPVDQAFFGLRFRERGYPIKSLFKAPWNLHVMSFQSFFGLYARMEMHSPPSYYMAIGALSIALLSAIVFLTLKDMKFESLVLLLITVLAIFSMF